MPEILETNVKIKADASSLKKEANDSISALERLQDKYEEVSAALSKAFASNGKAEYISSLTEQRNELLHLINDIKAGVVDLNSIDISHILGEVDTSPVENVKEKVDEVDQSLKDVKETQKEVNNGWDTKGIEKMLKGIKKVAASIIGVSTVFSLIRKSMNAYLAQNDSLKQKLNGIYYALGSLFAPILEWLVNLFAKIVLYVNAFLRGLGFAGIQFKNISKSAQKTQKTMRTLISGFDELNTLQKNSSEENDAAISDPFADVKVNQEWMDKLYKLGEKLRPVLEWIIQKCKEIWDWLWKHKELVLTIIGIIAGMVIISKLTDIINKLTGVWDVLKTIGSAIFTFITSPLGGVILMFAGWSAAVIAFVEMWKNGWSLVGEIIKDVGIALMAVGAIILGVPASIAATVAAIVAVLSTLAIVIHQHWDEISAWLSKKWEDIKNTAKKIWEGINTTINNVMESCGTWLQNTWNGITTWLSESWTNLGVIAGNLWDALRNKVEEIVKNLAAALKTLWENIRVTATNAWQNISNMLVNIMTGIKNFFVNSWTFIKNTVISLSQQMATGISNIWQGIVNVIKGAVNGIIGFINGMIRGIVGGINAVINVLNKLHFSIPSWVPGFGGKSFGFNIRNISAPQISYLAQGGVITGPTLAMMGEYSNAGRNPEIVTPERLLKEMLTDNNSELVNAFAQMTGQIISAINDVDMEVKIGDDTIARSASRGNNSYKLMTGRPLITM